MYYAVLVLVLAGCAGAQFATVQTFGYGSGGSGAAQSSHTRPDGVTEGECAYSNAQGQEVKVQYEELGGVLQNVKSSVPSSNAETELTQCRAEAAKLNHNLQSLQNNLFNQQQSLFSNLPFMAGVLPATFPGAGAAGAFSGGFAGGQNGGFAVGQNGGFGVGQNGGFAVGQNGGFGVGQNGGFAVGQNGGFGVGQNGGFAVGQNGGFGVGQNGGFAVGQNGGFAVGGTLGNGLPQTDAFGAAKQQGQGGLPGVPTGPQGTPNTDVLNFRRVSTSVGPNGPAGSSSNFDGVYRSSGVSISNVIGSDGISRTQCSYTDGTGNIIKINIAESPSGKTNVEVINGNSLKSNEYFAECQRLSEEANQQARVAQANAQEQARQAHQQAAEAQTNAQEQIRQQQQQVAFQTQALQQELAAQHAAIMQQHQNLMQNLQNQIPFFNGRRR